MPVQEITFVGERLEVYFGIQDETGEIKHAYWPKSQWFYKDKDEDEEDREEVPHHEAKDGSVHVFAIDPDEAFRIAKRDLNLTGEDEKVLDKIFLQPRPGTMHEPIPLSFEVQPLKEGQEPKGKTTCGHCGLSWDDDLQTTWTPVPSGRCPFEYFHIYDEDEEEDDDE